MIGARLQDVVITTRQVGYTFLQRELTARNAVPRTPVDSDNYIFWSFDMSAQALTSPPAMDKYKGRAFYLEMSDGNRMIDIWVRPELRGQGLGPFGAKCAVGIVHELGHDEMEISNVRATSASVWAALGGHPIRRPVELPGLIADTLDKNRDTLVSVSIATLDDIRRTAENHSFAGWTALSQSDIKLEDGSYFRNAVFRHWQGQDMILPLYCPVTRTILQKKLGALPPCRFNL